MYSTNPAEIRLRNKINAAIVITIIGLLLNGISAVPLRAELNVLLSNPDSLPSFLRDWWNYVNKGINETSDKYPFMRYGFDWLAFAHILIALAFLGPLRDPVKNQWVIQWGMLASLFSIVVALGWEWMRDIPFWWSLLDASIGIVAFIVLWFCNHWIVQLINLPAERVNIP